MIRILHILHSMNRGGAEAMLMNYYRNMDRTKVQFDFLLTEQNHCQYEDEILSMGGKVFRVPLLTAMNPLAYIRGVKSFLSKHQEYRIVHSHTSSKSAVPLWVAKQCGIPVRICHAHSSDSGHGIEGFVRKVLGIWLKQVATDYMACGEGAGRCWYGDDYVNHGRVLVISNAIDNNTFAYNQVVRNEKRGKYQIADDTMLLGMVARFHPVKNHNFALEVLKTLKESGANVKLMLVGDGELHDEIVGKIKSLDLEQNVILVGIVSDVHKYLQAMDVVLMPSFNEGLPVSMIEAQASGVQCVVSTSVPKEVDVTGNVTFLPLDVTQWTERITSIPAGWRDKNATNKVRTAGYDILSVVENLQKWYIQKWNSIK